MVFQHFVLIKWISTPILSSGMELGPFSKVTMDHKYTCKMENYKTPLTHRRNPHGLMIKTTFVDRTPKGLCMIEITEKLDLIKIKTSKQASKQTNKKPGHHWETQQCVNLPKFDSGQEQIKMSEVQECISHN